MRFGFAVESLPLVETTAPTDYLREKKNMKQLLIKLFMVLIPTENS